MRGRNAPASSGGLGGKLLVVAVLGWVVVGIIAAGQRSHFEHIPSDCAEWATILVTAAAGPGNYVGLNPKIDECQFSLPEPSE